VLNKPPDDANLSQRGEKGIPIPNRKGCGRGQTLYCFSPPVMLATFVIECGLAAYVFQRYRKSLFASVATAVLLLLAVFQLSEYQICANQDAIFWSRLGLAAITVLPVLGLYLISLVSHKKHFLRLGYVAATVSVVLILLAPRDLISPICAGNYVTFGGPEVLYRFYAAYYFGFLLIGIWESVEALNVSRSKRVHRILRWMVIGYLSFMLPMGIVYAFYEPARMAVASIMCGFALGLAFILALRIVPEYCKRSFPVAQA
jgi:hypothetical protein